MTSENNELFSNKFGFNTISLKELFELYKNDNYIPYAQYLRTNELKTKRLEILDRDLFRCIKCNGFETKVIKTSINTPFGNVEDPNLEWSSPEIIIWTNLEGKEKFSTITKPIGKPNKSYNLHIHHKKYVINKLPWEYSNDDLETLCNHCHKKVHEEQDIFIYNEDGNIILDYNNCDRCNGTGYLAQYKYIQNGICFKCKGARFSILLVNKKTSD
jgi:hypothetical protein